MDAHQLLAVLARDADDHAVELEEAIEAATPWLRLLGAILDGAPGSWAADAACKGQTDVMFPSLGGNATEARQLCARCPVAVECDRWAATVPASQRGVIAGTTERHRAKIRKYAARIADAA